MLHSLVRFCKVCTFCELVFEHLFSFSESSCFSTSFIGIENIFATTRNNFANVENMESLNVITETLWILPKSLQAGSYPKYWSPISKRRLKLLLFPEKNVSSGNMNCWKNLSLP